MHSKEQIVVQKFGTEKVAGFFILFYFFESLLKITLKKPFIDFSSNFSIENVFLNYKFKRQ